MTTTLAPEPQLPLFDTTPQTIEQVDGSQYANNREHFEAFHAQNAHVYYFLRDLALQDKHSGATKGGIRQYWEIARWSYRVQTGDHRPSFPNNLTPYYARMLMEYEPELDGFFDIREIKDE